jgi:hypothetical protein
MEAWSVPSSLASDTWLIDDVIILSRAEGDTPRVLHPWGCGYAWETIYCPVIPSPHLIGYITFNLQSKSEPMPLICICATTSRLSAACPGTRTRCGRELDPRSSMLPERHLSWICTSLSNTSPVPT